MKNITLNEELLNQIRLIKYDRSKTLFEQPGYESYLDQKNQDIIKNDTNRPINCMDKDKFLESYPFCCRHKDIATIPPEGKEFLHWDETKKMGYCYYKDGRGYGINLRSDDEIFFTDVPVIFNMVMAISEKFKENDYELLKTDIGQNPKLQFLIKTKTDEGTDLLKARNESIKEYFNETLNRVLPINSIYRFKLKSGRDYSVGLTLNELGEIMLNWYFDSEGSPYEMPKFEDHRTGYQKFVDEWGALISIVVAVGAGIATGGLGAIGVLIEVAVDLGLSTAIAIRELQRGENVQAFFTMLFPLIPALKLRGAFRGITKEGLEKAFTALKNSGLTNTSTAEDYVAFLTRLSETDPETAKLVAMTMKYDDVTKYILKKELPDMVKNNVIKQLEQTIRNNPNIIKNVKFWKGPIGKELKYAGGLVLINIIANIVLGPIFDDEKKKKLSEINSIIPKKHQEEFYINMGMNMDLVPKFLDEYPDKLLKDAKKGGFDPERFIKLVKQDHKEFLEKNGRQYVELPESPVVVDLPEVQNDEWFLSRGYVKYDLYDTTNTFNDGDELVLGDSDQLWLLKKQKVSTESDVDDQK